MSPIENGALVEFKETSLSSVRVFHYATWNEAVSGAIQLLNEEFIKDEISIDEMAKRYRELEPRIEDLIDELKSSKLLGSSEIHLIEQIESILEG